MLGLWWEWLCWQRVELGWILFYLIIISNYIVIK